MIRTILILAPIATIVALILGASIVNAIAIGVVLLLLAFVVDFRMKNPRLYGGDSHRDNVD